MNLHDTDAPMVTAVGRVFCEPQGRATDEWLLRYLQRAVAELQITVDALTERVERMEPAK